MRRIGEAVDSAPFTPPTLAPQDAPGAATRRPRESRREIHAVRGGSCRLLLVLLRLPHDLSCAEIDVAGREGIADEEIVAELGIIILAVLEVGIFRRRERELDRLRHDLAFESGDRGVDRDRDLSRTAAAGRALEPLICELRAELAEAIL